MILNLEYITTTIIITKSNWNQSIGLQCKRWVGLYMIFSIENDLQSYLSLVLTWIRMLDLLLQIWFLFASVMKNISSS